MARRPRVFDQAAFEEVLRELGYAGRQPYWIAQNFKLVVPFVLKNLGPERISEIIVSESQAYGLRDLRDMTPDLPNALVRWAESELTRFQLRRSAASPEQQDDEEPEDEDSELGTHE